MNDPIYCSKCKKKTSNFNTITTQTSNGHWRVSGQCLKCKTNKIQFIKAPTTQKKKLLDDEDKLLWAKELHKLVRTHFNKRRILTKGIDDLWAADLIDMKKYSEENEGNCYLLNVIDTFSKFAWALPIKKKDGVTVSKAFDKIIKSAESQKHKSPNLLHTDKSLEFENKHFKSLLSN